MRFFESDIFGHSETLITRAGRENVSLHIYTARCAPVRTGAQRATYERVFKRFESWNFLSKAWRFRAVLDGYSGVLSTCPLGPNYLPIGAQHLLPNHFGLVVTAGAGFLPLA